MNAKKILVVEDDMLVQKLIADTLRAAGYEVKVAKDGATAVKVAREFEPDVITLDILLAKDSPDDSWDGFSVISWLRRMSVGKQVATVIVVSGLEPSDVIQKAAAIGAYTLLPKPVGKQKLLEAVAQALSSASSPSGDQSKPGAS
jgi:two-component system, OmpR family, response regulator